jgi:rhamnosyltransferase
VGGFPERTLFAEDMLVAAKMILAGYSVAYQADAVCEHWHDYSISEEFRRAFDIGVFHHREHWVLEEFGSAEGEGGSLILTGLRKIASENTRELPIALMKYLAKVLGYTAGRSESLLPVRLKRRLSMNRAFWSKND